jgi:hypothetical protein
MGGPFRVIPCAFCGHTAWLPQVNLVEIRQRRHRPSLEPDFVNWVCERCGRGSLHIADKLKPQEPDAVTEPMVSRRPIYRTFLECETCTSHVVVDTLAQSANQTANPVKPRSDWKVEALKCPSGHHPKLPPVVACHVILGREDI